MNIVGENFLAMQLQIASQKQCIALAQPTADAIWHLCGLAKSNVLLDDKAERLHGMLFDLCEQLKAINKLAIAPRI